MNESSRAQREEIERRQKLRCEGGKQVIGLDPLDGRPPIACSVKDISEAGVRLKLSKRWNDMKLPPIVRVMTDHETFHARIVWQNDDEIGLAFLAP
jgi:hypothetical protein